MLNDVPVGWIECESDGEHDGNCDEDGPTDEVLHEVHILVRMRARCVQGDTSRFSLGCVDMKTKVWFQYMLPIQKCNFWFDVNRTEGTT